jgi:MFS family permease
MTTATPTTTPTTTPDHSSARNVSRRLAPLYVSAFVGGVALWIPVEKLFMSEIGFTPATIGIMAAAYAAVVPLLEIPSGVLADRWSRRGVLMVGNAGALISIVVGGLSTNVAAYIVAALMLGVYFAMQTGTLDSIVYDAVLEESGSSDGFDAALGRVQAVSGMALVVGAVAGGLLGAATSPRVTYFATVPFVVGSMVALLRFREPSLHQVAGSHSLREHVRTTVDTLRSQPGIAPIVGLLVLTTIVSQTVFEFGPLWLVAADADTALYGPAWAALMMSLTLGGVIAARIRLDERGPALIGGSLIVGGAAVLLVAHDPIVASAAQVVIATVAVAFGVVGTRLLHDRVPSAVRSSVSSGVGAGSWVAFLPVSLTVGTISEHLGVHASAWLLVGAGAATAGLLVTAARHRAPAATAVPARADSPAVAELPCAERRLVADAA